MSLIVKSAKVAVAGLFLALAVDASAASALQSSVFVENGTSAAQPMTVSYHSRMMHHRMMRHRMMRHRMMR